MRSYQGSKENKECNKELILETEVFREFQALSQLQENNSEKITILRKIRRGVQKNPSFREC